ncbi:MAG: hypothetical protein LUD16_08580 [Lachnospiraceae bacterium]|nr:hypothetical protein [Lachnospiraceae bacterium]
MAQQRGIWVVLIFAFLIFQFAPMRIVSLFGSESELYNEFAVKCFRIFLLACPINGCQMVSSVFFQAIGKTTQATALSLTRQIIFLLPATLDAANIYGASYCQNKDLQSQAFLKISCSLIASKHHPLAKLSEIDVSALNGENLLCLI